MLKRFIRMFAGDPTKKEIDRYSEQVEAINALEPVLAELSDEALKQKTSEFKQRLADGETLDDLLVEAFAAVREASKRAIGQRHYDVQLIGGIVLHRGKIAEMRTGEGKTLVATLPLYLNALPGKGVHLITVNDYLARRDARWMAPIFSALGLSVGVLQMAARTENGKKAFLVDFERQSPHEDQHQLRMTPRAEAYAADITYGTNSEFGFDYLRDNMTMTLEERVQRGHHYAVVDEVDNVLIDEARTPLIISGPAEDQSQWYLRLSVVARQLRPEDVEVNEKDRVVVLTEIGETHVEQILGTPLRDPDRPEDLSPEQARILGYLEQALRAQFLFRKNKDYLVQSGKVIIIDEFTGRLMPGRRWSEGLHQAIEAKEGVKVEPESVTYATITIQNYFRMYSKLAGMTGTAVTESEEFDKIYKLEAVPIPTNLELQASQETSDLVELEDKDSYGYKYRFYSRRSDPEKTPLFWRRKDYPDIVYRTEEMKLRAITQEILRFHVLGRPVLVGTTSVELSERVSTHLRTDALRKLTLALILRKVWLEQKNRQEEGRQIPELQFLYAPLDKLDVSEMRKMARDLEISANPEDPENLTRLEALLDLSGHDRKRLVAVLQGGINHEVLNARKHTEESQIIAGAGGFGAVTIATNMAGRGVDIKLGGELAEELLAGVNRVLRRSGIEDPYNMTMEQRRQALSTIDRSEFGIYESEVDYFLQYLDDMQRVRDLGGLHVIGSERHEARRIDNQLRGRAARQGDPGSSRFYLSMEDQLMRLFGGGQADSLMQRLKIDDAVPLEANLVGRLVEQAQTRVEGANFDMRKHLLEYDDVLNNQRNRIYSQRNLVFTKTDLSEDVRDMLKVEIARRVPQALEKEEGPWELLAWLNDIQPAFVSAGEVFPSFTIRLLLEEITSAHQTGKNQAPLTLDHATAANRLVRIVSSSLEAEKEHLLKALDDLLDKSHERIKTQASEREEALDLYFEGLRDDPESENRRPLELFNEVQNAVKLPLRLAPEQQRLLRSGSKEIRSEINQQVRQALASMTLMRLVGSIERRLDEPLGLSVDNLPTNDWEDVRQQLVISVEDFFEKRSQRFIGNGTPGQVVREIESAVQSLPEPVDPQELIKILLQVAQGTRASFDKRTHQKVVQRTNRLAYFYHAAQLIANQEVEEISSLVLSHLESALDALKASWGQVEWTRLSTTTLTELEPSVQENLVALLGAGAEAAPASPLNTFPAELHPAIQSELGRKALTEIFRQLLLSVMSNLWIDYLTEVEALRISIGLEAYAQRDPLVQYKNRASGLFQELLANIRLGVINKMFTFRPRIQTTEPAQAAQPAPAARNAPTAAPADAKPAPKDPEQAAPKKRRRH